MSDFIDGLIKNIKRCDFYDETGTLEMVESLGENARRMLEIGILQDELAALGFSFNFSIDTMEVDNVLVEFYKDEIIVFGEDSRNIFNRGLPTWQQDVINKVKELLNDK